MARLLCFVGTGNYQLCRYRLCEGVSSETPYIQVALFELIPKSTQDRIEEVLVFATNQAREKHWQALDESISPHTKLTPVEIPSGKSEEELWDLFRILNDHIREEERFYLDITHGFRSLPILVALLLGYVDVVKRAKPTAIYYGAHEARGEDGVAPVFDLSPFVQILDWTRGVDHFLRTGDSSLAEDLIRELERQNIRKRIAEGEDPRDIPKVLKPLSEKIRFFRECFSMVRAQHTISEASQKLLETIDRVQQEAEKLFSSGEAAPFQPIWEQLRARVKPLAAENPYSIEGVKAQRELIRLYRDTGHPVEAISLAREWIPSIVLKILYPDPEDCDVLTDMESRQWACHFLNQMSNIAPLGEGEEKEKYDFALETLQTRLGKERIEALVSLWGKTIARRNDIDHCGTSTGAAKAQSLVHGVEEVLSELLDLDLEQYLKTDS